MIATQSKPLDYATTSETPDAGWRGLYRLAGIAALMMLGLALLDITVSMTLPKGELSPTARDAVAWFTLFQTNTLYGLRDLGLLNILTAVLNVPVYLALYTLHRRTQPAYALLALILFVMGGVIYVSNNPALPLLALSGKYAAAAEIERTALVAAGEALLARGADFTLGSLIGMTLPLIANLVLAGVLLRGGVFRKIIAYVGILSALCLLIFTGMTVFFPASFSQAMLIAMPGGLLALAWNWLIAQRLFQLTRMV